MSEELGTTTAAALGIGTTGERGSEFAANLRRRQAATHAALLAERDALVAERDALKKALGEVHRRTGLLMHQNMGRWNMSVEHDKWTYEVLGVNQIIALAALEPQP